MSLIVIVIVPLLAGIVSWFSWDRRVAPGVTLAASSGVLILALRAAFRVTAGHPVVAIPDWVALDGLSALILLLIALVGTTAALFSWGYMAKRAHSSKELRLYYTNYNLFLFSMLAVPVLTEPNLVWIAVELTTLFSVLLVGFGNTREALEAAWKYVVLTLMGAAIALLGFLVLFWAMRVAGGATYTWEGLRIAAPHMPPSLLRMAFLLILVGFGAKVGLVPLHTWLPDAHSQAPSPVCALLSGVETTAVLYVILRLLPVVNGVPHLHTEVWMLVFGLASVGVAAVLLLQVRDYKRLFAFSTVEHMGIILAAAALGSPAAQYGAISQILSHALTKSFCFYAAGAVLLAVGSREIGAVRGLIRTSPAAGIALLLGGLAIAGAPPFAVFLSEFSIFQAGLAQGQYLATGLLALFIGLAFFAILVHINRMVFGRPEGEPLQQVSLPPTCVAALTVGAALVIILGFYLPEQLHELLRLSSASLGR